MLMGEMKVEGIGEMSVQSKVAFHGGVGKDLFLRLIQSFLENISREGSRKLILVFHDPH